MNWHSELENPEGPDLLSMATVAEASEVRYYKDENRKLRGQIEDLELKVAALKSALAELEQLLEGEVDSFGVD